MTSQALIEMKQEIRQIKGLNDQAKAYQQVACGIISSPNK
jgi:hypothetical protein